MAKVFEVVVEQVITDHMFVYASDKQNARKIAQQLIDAGLGERDTSDTGAAEVAAVYQRTKPAAHEITLADVNSQEFDAITA